MSTGGQQQTRQIQARTIRIRIGMQARPVCEAQSLQPRSATAHRRWRALSPPMMIQGSTGNLTQQTSWDSTKGGYSNPLNGGNSISVSNQYDFWSSGTSGRLIQTT